MANAARSPVPTPQRVEITVKDKAGESAEVFQCDLSLLRASMTYFEPLIKKQLQQWQQEQQEQQQQQGGATAAAAVPISLKVNCEIPIFKWLLAWTENTTRPKLTAANAVSIVLSSDFLGMHELTEVSLHYIKDHLAEVLLSGVDMGCVPGDLLGRLSAIVTEASMANCLYTLYQRKEERHPNRSFVSALLRHWVAERLMLLSASPTKAGGDPFASTAARGGRDSGKLKAAKAADSDNGLRWCCVCGVLYDERELRRLLANNGASLSSPLNTKEPHCAGRHRSSSSSNSGGLTARLRIGSRGERLTTHAPSRLLPWSTLSASPTGMAGGAARSALEVPAYTGGSARQDLQVERWAWRLIGTTRFTVCRRCRHLVPLLEVATHACSSNHVKAEFVPAERFGSAGSAGSTDMQSLIRWIEFASKEGVYADVGGLRPIVCPAGTAGLLEAESIAAPVCVEPLAGGEDQSGRRESVASGDAAEAGAHPQQQQQQQRRRGSATEGEGYLESGGVPRSWAEMPTAVAEVTAIAPNDTPSAGKPVSSTRPGCPVDVDIANFHERQFGHAMEEQLARLMAADNPSASAVATGRVAGGNVVKINCPTLCSYPYVAPPSAPTSFASSPRPMSTSVGGVRRAGGGSLVLGTSLSMAKPSAKKKRVSTARK